MPSIHRLLLSFPGVSSLSWNDHLRIRRFDYPVPVAGNSGHILVGVCYAGDQTKHLNPLLIARKRAL
jgi:hypothetical protein